MTSLVAWLVLNDLIKESKFFILTIDSKNSNLLVLSNNVCGKEKLKSFKVRQNLLFFELKLACRFNSGHHRLYPHHQL